MPAALTDVVTDYKTEYFDLRLESDDKRTHLLYTALSCISTRAVPDIVQLLTQFFPQVLETACFNGKHQPFSEEVKNTPVSHLFEHILIRTIHDSLLERTGQDLSIQGFTKWDWINEEKGTFHIEIALGSIYKDIILDSIDKSISLMGIILAKSEKQVVCGHLL